MDCRIIGLATALALLAGAAGAGAKELDQPTDFYTGRTIVTGTDMRARPTGFRICLEDVLVKTTGDQRLLQDPRVKALAASAGDFVEHYDYFDRMSDLPVHDEQGTNDRPYYITCVFDQAKIDAELSKLGHKAWTDMRPPLTLIMAVHGFGKSGILTSDGDFFSPDMRISLSYAAERYGMLVSLPSVHALTANQVAIETLTGTPIERLTRVAQRSGGALPLVGTLDWSDADLGWVGHWTLDDGQRRSHQWTVKGVNFDEAFRNAVRGAAQILSGNGEP
ncbi:MAG: DUF2066 domain-containing protein [Dongia sp.]